MTEKKCRACRKFAERKGEEPDCEDCIPPLHDENVDAYEVYRLCNRQVIMSYGGPVDIDIRAVEVAMSRLGIEDDQVFFDVVRTWREVNGERQEQQALKQQAKDGHNKRPKVKR